MDRESLLNKGQPAWRPPVGSSRGRFGKTVRWSLLVVLLLYLFSQFFHNGSPMPEEGATPPTTVHMPTAAPRPPVQQKPEGMPKPTKPKLPVVDVDVALDEELADDSDDTVQQNTSSKPIKYILYRAVGNDLPPRHALGQSYTNVKYILENEEDIPEVEKRWVVNRIVVAEEERKILDLLKEHNQKYIHVPIDLNDYSERQIRFEGFGDVDMLHSKYFRESAEKHQIEIVDAMLHDKNLYVMHNNGARNIMLEDGIKNSAEWIMPFDGNCFLTRRSWEGIKQGIQEHGHRTKYFVVPMIRLQSNDELFDPNFEPGTPEEPQIVFRFDAKERFNPNMRYGRRPKVELLWRLQVPGPWDKWPQSIGVWEKKEWTPSDDVKGPGDVPSISWIPRLYSGQGNLEKAGTIVNRGLSRSQGVEALLTKLDAAVSRELHGFSADKLLAFNETILAMERTAYKKGTNTHLNGLVGRLLQCANTALKHGPFSVLHKTEKPPSDDKHDYYNPAPYYWPNPNTPDGLPYIRKDGQRVPGTELYDAESEKYDRSRVASLFGNTTCLSLAWYFTGDAKYATHAAANIRTWFLDPETAMNPNMRYAQIQWGYNGNEGANYGVIETKDLYFLLDAVRLAHRAGALTEEDMEGMRGWLLKFSEYLLFSKQGQDEYYTLNNHGLYYDVQLASIAAFLDDLPLFFNHTERAKGRILEHFASDGSLPKELKRPTSLHYMMFTMQGWYTLARLASNAGVDLWHYKHSTDDAPCLLKGAVYAVPQLNATWSHPQVDMEDMERMLPLYYTAITHYPQELQAAKGVAPFHEPPHVYDIKGEFFTHDGIQMYWNLGMTTVGLH